MPANIEIEILHDVPADIEVLLEYGGTEVSVEIGQDPVPSLELEFANIGPRGLSAYEVALANGFVGTEAEWLASIAGTIDGGIIF